MPLIRLQKIISESGLISRRKADLLIIQGKVTLNGRQAIAGEKADPFVDNILVEDLFTPVGTRDIDKSLNILDLKNSIITFPPF